MENLEPKLRELAEQDEREEEEKAIERRQRRRRILEGTVSESVLGSEPPPFHGCRCVHSEQL